MKIEKIGKKFLKMNDAHKLPEYYGKFSLYDRTLPRIAKELKKIDGGLFFVDIGANIGDTVSLVTDEVDGDFLCVEGDQEYLDFLKENTENITGSNVIIEESFCGEKKDGKGKIIKEEGTARLEKNENENDVRIKTLDEIIDKNKLFYKTNLLKIDTDGFEISVLKSGKNFLSKSQPTIYFEFNPEFYKNNNFEPLEVFDFLLENGYEKGLFYDNFGLPIKIINFSDQKEIKSLIELINKKEIYYFDVLTISNKKYKKILEEEILNCLFYLNNGLSKSKNAFKILDNRLLVIQSELTNKNNRLIQLQSELTNKNNRLIQLQSELTNIFNSREWKMILKLQEVFKIFFPKKSLRRKGLIFLFGFAKIFLKAIFKARIFIRRFFFNMESELTKFKPREKRKINLKSKKIVYIGHSYHNKTKSTEFLIEYLKQFFDVTVVLDESWQGKPAPDLSFIDKSYLGVIFFQLLPSPEIIKKIKNNNIVYFPMYDQSGTLGLNFWGKYRDLKIINFSQTLHKKLEKWGFESMYIQYFPPINDFFPGKKDEVFFWQRLTIVNFDVIKKVFGDLAVKIHLHRAVDPDQNLFEPSKEDEEKFKISYSDWFDTRKEMWEIIKDKAIYVAPREYEGIGMSFLEAMAMGKAVVAVDNPTMNEYIKNEETGYLFDLNKPKIIDFSQIEKVQKNTYAFMKKGEEKWKKERSMIIDFIKKS